MTKPIIVTGVAAAVLAIAPAVQAKEGDIIRTGNCTRATDWKLKLSPEDRGIEVELEVDQNRVGHRWTITLRRNGALVFQGSRVTRGPSGSFELRRVLANRPGTDRVSGVARNLRTGELCRAAARFPA